jgi:hypothetical protein
MFALGVGRVLFFSELRCLSHFLWQHKQKMKVRKKFMYKGYQQSQTAMGNNLNDTIGVFPFCGCHSEMQLKILHRRSQRKKF